METKIILEAVGYIGTALVILSMMMTSVLRLRVVNMAGSAISAFYALAVGAYPVVILNAALIIVNSVKIVQFFRVEKSYQLVETDGAAGLPNYLAQKHKDDILNYFPDFKGLDKDDKVFVLMNGDCATGITAGKIDGENFFISIDYTTPAYRDNSAGRFLYKEIARRGLKKAVLETRAKNHEAYMYKMGFVKISRGKYVKEL